MKPLKTKVSITLDENVIQPIWRKTKFYSHTLCTLAFNTDSLLLYHSLSNRSFSKMWICNIIIHTISLSFYIAHNTAERKTGSNQADTKPYFPDFSMILHTYPKIQKIQIFKARLSVKHFSFTNDVIQKLFI